MTGGAALGKEVSLGVLIPGHLISLPTITTRAWHQSGKKGHVQLLMITISGIPLSLHRGKLKTLAQVHHPVASESSQHILTGYISFSVQQKMRRRLYFCFPHPIAIRKFPGSKEQSVITY
jgi:hypothetical protein